MNFTKRVVLFFALITSVSFLPATAGAGDGRNHWYAPIGIPCRQFPYNEDEVGAASRAKEECERVTKKTCTTYSAPIGAPGYIC